MGRNFVSQKNNIIVLGLMMALLLSACASAAAATETAPQVQPTAEVAAVAATTAPATEAPATVAPAQPTATEAPAVGAATEPLFSKDIKPMFETSCVGCHGGLKTSKGLDLKTYASLMAGSQNGAVVTAGDPDNSKLVQLILAGKMPKKGPKLTAEQLKLITGWIKAGAKDN